MQQLKIQHSLRNIYLMRNFNQRQTKPKMDRYKITFETWNKIASLYQEKFMELDLYDDSYDIFCNEITMSNPRILEIGCGPGNITKYLFSTRPDFKIEAIDIAPNMIKLAKENNPNAHFSVMDCREINKLTGRFDAIMCGFCLPYLSKEDSLKLIKDSYGLLNEGGVFYFSAIEDDYLKSGFETGSSGDKTYVYYHEEKYLKEALGDNGFEQISVIRKNYPKGQKDGQIHLIFIVRKT